MRRPAWLRQPRFIVALLMGFSSGLPLLMVRSNIKTWLTEAHVDIKQIGFFSLIFLPHGLKFLWAPAMDRFAPLAALGFGRRRGWLAISQLGVVTGLIAIAFSEPAPGAAWAAALACLWTSFWGASQDVVIDAYRRESFPDEELGAASSLYVAGYRVALVAAGAGVLYLAQAFTWQTAYLSIAGLMSVGFLTGLAADEPDAGASVPHTLKEATVGPFYEFFSRKSAWLVLAFILLYKLGESMASDMFNPFYVQTGFTKVEIANVAKLLGFWSAIIGGLFGGWLVGRMSLMRALLLFGILQSAPLLLMAVLSEMGPRLPMLALAIGTENFSSGMATAAFMAFMASQTARRFAATQYALLSSLIGVTASFAGATTGLMVDRLGWTVFFVACTILTLPALGLLWPLSRALANDRSNNHSAASN